VKQRKFGGRRASYADGMGMGKPLLPVSRMPLLVHIHACCVHKTAAKEV
jgi:hypothetical protein